MSLSRKHRVTFIVAGLLAVPAIAGIAFYTTIHTTPREDTPASTNTVVALGYYSASLPSSVRSFVYNWFNNHGLSSSSTDNVTVHPGTYTEKIVSHSGTTYKEVTFILDFKEPNVSYRVSTGFNTATLSAGEQPASISCPDPKDQHGDASLCTATTGG